MTKVKTVLKISTMSVALLSATAVATVLVTPDVAYAGKGNDNGNGNGGNGNGGNGNGGNGKSGGGGAKADKSDSKGKSALARGNSGKAKTSRGPQFSLKGIFGGKDRKKTASKPKRTVVKKAAPSHAPKVAKAPAPKPRKPSLAHVLGVHPSALGALNAAHASPQALANASPNSRVGKLAIYMDKVAASRELQDQLDAAKAELELIEQMGAAIETAKTERSELQTELDGLNDDLTKAVAAADGSDAAIEADIKAAEEKLAAKDEEITALENEYADGQAYDDAVSAVETLEGELEQHSDDQRAALEAAANKEVTDEVEAAVQKLLGIYEEPEVVENEVVEDDEVVEEVATLE